MSTIVGSLRHPIPRVATLVVAATAALFAFERVHAQADQRLDGIVVYGATQAQGVAQTPVLREIYYTSDPVTGMAATPIAGTHDLKACQGTGTRGLYCLDYDAANNKYAVLRWKDPDNSTVVQEEIDCAQLGLVTCTAMTVNLRGHIFVAGQKTAGNPNSYSLFKLTEKVGSPISSCPGEDDSEPGTQWDTTTDDRYCFREVASSRPRIYDMKTIDGELSGSFMGEGRGVLALEDPAPGQVTFYADRQPLVSPIVYVQPGQWGNNNLSGGTVYGLTLLQYAAFAEAKNFIMVTTTTGKVLGYQIPWSGNSNVFDTGLLLNSTSMSVTTGAACTASGSSFDLSASARTRRVFFASGTCVAAYDPVLSSRNNARIPITFGTKSFGIASDFSLLGVAVSPGIEIDFVRDGCTTAAGCTLLKDGDANTHDAARFAKIQLVDNGATGWVMYHVTGLLDCRYVSPRPAICATAVINPDGEIDLYADDGIGDPTQQFLDLEDLLPPEVKDAVALPSQMLVQPDYSAPKSSTPGLADYTFGALFGVPEENLIYRDTFDGSFDVGDLIGSSLGCGGVKLQPDSLIPPPLDVVLNLSELAPTVGGPVGVSYPPNAPATVAREFVSMLLNDGCSNPTSLAGGRGSAFIYGLGVSPKGKDGQGRWLWPDSAFALLMRSLAADFGDHLFTYACQDLDSTSGLAPLSPTTCYNLQKDWPVVLDKLTKCVDATDQPKNSSGSEACNSFETQFEPFKAQVAAATLQPDALDLQNRVGETKARMIVLSYVYYSQFKPSLKKGGFVNPN